MSAGQTGHMTGQMGHVHGTDGTHTKGCPAQILHVYGFFSFPQKETHQWQHLVESICRRLQSTLSCCSLLQFAAACSSFLQADERQSVRTGYRKSSQATRIVMVATINQRKFL